MVRRIAGTAHALTTANIVTITLTIAIKADRKLLVTSLKIGTFFPPVWEPRDRFDSNHN
jgi:hypothetical protein